MLSTLFAYFTLKPIDIARLATSIVLRGYSCVHVHAQNPLSTMLIW